MPRSALPNPPSETAIPDLVRELEPIFGPRVKVDVVPWPESPDCTPCGDFRVTVRWESKTYDFVAEAKTRSTPRILDNAIHQVRAYAARSGLRPMVITPFLSEERIEHLMREEVSGIDLSGNGLVLIPGELLLRRSGRPNRYPESQPARHAYRGTTSLVARVFFRRPAFDSVGQIRSEIQAAGASVALSTVSKALARMTDDLVVDRAGPRIVLQQPDKLLDLLAENFVLPRTERSLRAKLNVPLEQLLSRTADQTAALLVLSGSSSQSRYAAGLRSDEPILYTRNLDKTRKLVGELWTPTDRFADVTVIETRDPTPFFDLRRDASGAAYASPVQCYLELITSGDKRDKDIAAQIRTRIIADLQR